MSIRMRKQTLRKVIGSEKGWVPGPGKYEHGTKRDVGNDPRRLQQWKSPLRNNTWMVHPTDAADVMYSSLQDHQSINAKVKRGEQRMATVMHKCLPRSPAELDSRRSNEKLKFKVFEVSAPVSTPAELGPGRYPHARPTDIGCDKRQFQAWKNPLRNNTWMQCLTDAPDGETYLGSSPFNMASRNKCGGYLKDCWPQPEDEYGRPVTTGLFVPRTPLAVGNKGKAPPATA